MSHLEHPTGLRIYVADLSLTCPICGVAHHNIPNSMVALPLEKEHPERRLYQVIGLDPDYICECLLAHLYQQMIKFNHLPIIALWVNKTQLN